MKCAAMARLRATLTILAIVLLITACSGGDGDKSGMGGMDMNGTPGDGETPMATELGAWNTLTAGALDISDGNNVLRAHYDSSGGHVVAEAPVQPSGTETATWTGTWSGKIDVNPNPASDTGLGILGLTREGLQALGGGANVTAYFENDDVTAAVTYEDVGLESLGLSQITSDRVSVTDGTFRPMKTERAAIPLGTGQLEVTGSFTGEGAFGGNGAMGVAGFMGGDISISYGRGPIDLGNFKSVFHGTKDSN